MQHPLSNGSAPINTPATQFTTLTSSINSSSRTAAASPQQRVAFSSYPIRGVLPPLASSSRNGSCVIPPPANCSGHGTLSGCTCNCSSGYANDLSNLLAPQWCKATAGIIPDGRPGVSPVPAPGAPGAPPAAGDTGTPNGTGGFMRTRMFWVLLVALLLLVLACGIWCFVRVRRRRARQRQKKKHRGKRSKSRRRESGSSDSSSVSSGARSSSSAADDRSSSSDSGSLASGKGKRGRGKPKGSGKHTTSREDKPAAAGGKVGKKHSVGSPALPPVRGSTAAAAHGPAWRSRHAGDDDDDGGDGDELEAPQHRQRYASAPGGRRPAAAFADDDMEAAPPVSVGRAYQSYTGGARLQQSPNAAGRQRQQYSLGPRQPGLSRSGLVYARGSGDEDEPDAADLRQVQVVVDATGALAYHPPHSGGGGSPRSRQLALNVSSGGGAPNWHRHSSGDPGLSAHAQAAAEQRGRFAASTPVGSMRPPAAVGAGSPRAHSSMGLRASDRQRALLMQPPVRQQHGRQPPPGRHEQQQSPQRPEWDDGY